MFDANPIKRFHEPHRSCLLWLLSPAMGCREAGEFFKLGVDKVRKFGMIILAAK